MHSLYDGSATTGIRVSTHPRYSNSSTAPPAVESTLVGSAHAAHSATRFIGRSDELSSLLVGLDDALAGRTTVVLVEGEAGIGKTRLLEELARLADSRLVPVVWGRASTVEGAPPFWPWRQVLRARSLDSELLEGGESVVAASEPTVAGERFGLFERVCDVLIADARSDGLVVLLDDLHAADRASLHLLAHLTRHRREARLLVACSVRTPGSTSTAGDELVLGLERVSSVTRLDLRGFGPDDVHAELASVLEHEPASDLAEDVWVRTNGNPLFVRELGRLLRTGGDDLDPGIPDAVRLVIGQRLAPLSTGARRTMVAAAVLGSEIDQVIVAAISEQAIETVIDHLAEAEALAIVVAPRRSGHPRFAHDLVRECLQDELSVSERARLHLRVADELALAGGDRLTEIAHHRLAALPLGDPSAAFTDAIAAARGAMDQLAFEDAAQLYEQALGVRADGPVDERARMAILLEAARALHFSHDLDGAMRACRESAALARRSGDGEALARAALLLQDVSNPAWIDEVEPWIAASLQMLPTEDSSVRAQLLAMHSSIRIIRAMPGGDESSLESFAMAERLDDIAALLAAYRARQMALSGPDDTQDRLELADRLIALGRDRAVEDAEVWGHLWRFDALVQFGRIAEASAELEELELLANRTGKPHIRWHVDRCHVTVFLAHGRFDQAWELGLRTGFVPTLANVARYTGERLDPAVEETALEVRQSPFATLQRLGGAVYALYAGRPDKAVELYARVPSPGGASLPRFLFLTANAFHVQAAIDLGDRDAVAKAYDQLLPYRHLHVVSGAGVVMTAGSVELVLGRAAAYLGRSDDAIVHLRAGLAVNEAAGVPPFAAEAAYHLALALLDQHTKESAREATRLLEWTTDVAERLGMQPLATSTQDALAKALATTTSEPASDPLSKREREIASLVADGLTNRQIAETAHISERTAENHVQHILTKLGFQNRSQIAAWFVQRGR